MDDESAYTVEEIVNLYKIAKDKKKQLSILHDLTGFPITALIEIVQRSGQEVPASAKNRKPLVCKKSHFSPEQTKEIHKMYLSGVRYKDIAKALNLPIEKIKNKINNDRQAGKLGAKPIDFS